MGATHQYLSFQRFGLPLKAVHIQCLDKDKKPIKNAYASGFVRQEAGGKFLYTCWHVVTGFDMHNLRIGNNLPNRKSLLVTLQAADVRQPGVIAIGGNQSFIMPLYDETQTPCLPLWIQDKQDIPQADLNAINLRVPFWHDAVKLQLPDDHFVGDIQTIEESKCLRNMIIPGDKVYIVGFPYGYSALGMDQPTPILLTRFVSAIRVAGRQSEILLDGAGAPGMSGGPVFVETPTDILLVGPYTGLIYPDHIIEKNEKVTALGTCCNMAILGDKFGE
ncbi:trypsin-like peptidase domain-containing protein [Methylovulum miyakonense]|uniref:trypsin-like peptidase domain-containing protein n=1 Tax=Methylovulum miyakonense TaxID=645578 RepID=UPI0003799BF6|nr:trypsin-like peptidase domain-containing protein [Methylovulum miyakonense]